MGNILESKAKRPGQGVIRADEGTVIEGQHF